MGEALGPYELLGELGRGGMGVVYRALHRPTGAVRALKVLDHAPDPESVERFRREAAALARAQGEGVVPVHDLGLAGGRLFFAMPLLEGGSLQQRLARGGPLAWRDACALTLELARALERCHALDLVHRDVKPANVLFDAQGRAHLADFGLVRDLVAARLTQTGTTLGTPSYMAPELYGAARGDARADVYSLGAVLYELVSGHPPYRASSPVQVLALATSEQRAPLPAGAPRALEQLVAAALAPEPGRRLATAGALAARLEGLLAGDPDRPAGRRAVLALAALAGVAALAAAGLLMWRSPAPTPATELPRGDGAVAPTATAGTVAAEASPSASAHAAVRQVLARGLVPPEVLIRGLEQALAAPVEADPALAAAIVSATDGWRREEPVLASVVFALAARVDERVAQPAGLVERLEGDLKYEASSPDLAARRLTALVRLGRRPRANHVRNLPVPLEQLLAEDPSAWAVRLALSYALHEQSFDDEQAGVAGKRVAMHERGLELAIKAERVAGLPRGARAVARLLQVQHRLELTAGEDLLAELSRLLEVADDLDCPEQAHAAGAQVALDARDLGRAAPFLEGLARAIDERASPADPEVRFIRRAARPWAAPAPRLELKPALERLRAFTRLLDGPRSAPLPAPLDERLASWLEGVGRVAEAARVRAALAERSPPR